MVGELLLRLRLLVWVGCVGVGIGVATRATAAQDHLLHLPDDGSGVVGLLPTRLRKVLLELFRYSAVDVLVAGRISRNPWMS